jgi:hypothetical protein
MSGAIETPLTRSLRELHLPAFRKNLQGQAVLLKKKAVPSPNICWYCANWKCRNVRNVETGVSGPRRNSRIP